MFSNHRAVSLVVLLAVTTFTVTIIIGCGGHGPTLPSPPGGGGGGGDVIEVEDFIVAAQEVVQYDTNTTVQVSGIVRIDGAVIGADGSGPGRAGVSITIEAEGDVTINGTVQAGDGGQAVDTLHVASKQADQTTGGDGGDLTLTSNQANVTLGEGAHVGGGEGANGGDSLTGGPGGRGGDVSINAPEGTATLPQSDSLIHQGNGGDGGTGDIQGDDIATFPGMDEPTANGGRGGKLAIMSATLAGLEILGDAPDQYILLEEGDGRFTGGGGGDGGPVTLGEEPQDGASAPAVSATAGAGPSGVGGVIEDGMNWVRGGRGADGYATEDGGQPGDGEWAERGLFFQTPETSDHAGCRGGDGGDQAFNTYTTPGGRELPIVPRKVFSGGKGGLTQVKGRKGMNSGPCEQPTGGGSATGRAGDGGRVREEQVPAPVWRIAPMNQSQGGTGGSTIICTAGDGGDAGDCCDPPGNGQDGGDAGSMAHGTGGDGGDQTLIKGGDGGLGSAGGGNGGHGAHGKRVGSGGSASTSVVGAGGRGGTGSPPGLNGQTLTVSGTDGWPGERCTAVTPPVEDGYNVFTRQLNSADARYYVKNVPVIVPDKSGARPAQATGVDGRSGPSMWVTMDGSRLFLAHYDNGIQVWDNPVAGVDATPDFLLTPNGLALGEIKAQSVWLDEASDNLYGLFIDTDIWRSRVYVWRNASAITANRAADSNFVLPRYERGSYLVGGANHNVLFIGGGIISDIYVIDNPAGRNGEVSPDRMITDTRPHGSGLAYDDTHNILYAFREDTGGLRRHTVRVVPNASAADGAPTFHEFYDTRLGDPHNSVVGLQVIGEDDLLFVGNQGGQLLVFGGASGLEGEVTADVSYQPDDHLNNFAVWFSAGP